MLAVLVSLVALLLTTAPVYLVLRTLTARRAPVVDEDVVYDRPADTGAERRAVEAKVIE